MYSGIAVSSGVAIGKAYLLDRSKVCVVKRSIPEKDIEKEIKRLRDAISMSKAQMKEIKTKGQLHCRQVRHHP